MGIIADITDPAVIQKILTYLSGPRRLQPSHAATR
jgi:hypothetical protein